MLSVWYDVSGGDSATGSEAGRPWGAADMEGVDGGEILGTVGTAGGFPGVGCGMWWVCGARSAYRTLWTPSICLRKLLLSPDMYTQKGHLKGFSPVCVLMCLSRSTRDLEA